MSADPSAIWSNARTLSVPIAGIREVTITPAYEHTELYTMDSSFRDRKSTRLNSSHSV